MNPSILRLPLKIESRATSRDSTSLPGPTITTAARPGSNGWRAGGAGRVHGERAIRPEVTQKERVEP